MPCAACCGRTDTVEPDAPCRPGSRAELFTAFTWLALQGFGGVLAVVQRELVEKRQWLTREQFVEDWAVAQIMPGPNVVNLSMMIGGRHFGLSGALAALAGMLLAPLALLLLIAVLYSQLATTPQAQGALRGMGAVAAGLIAATGLKLVGALRHNVMGMGACIAFAAASFVGVAVLRWPLAWVLLSLGTLACLWAWHRLAALARA
jgi:chromate transporter